MPATELMNVYTTIHNASLKNVFIINISLFCTIAANAHPSNETREWKMASQAGIPAGQEKSLE